MPWNHPKIWSKLRNNQRTRNHLFTRLSSQTTTMSNTLVRYGLVTESRKSLSCLILVHRWSTCLHKIAKVSYAHKNRSSPKLEVAHTRPMPMEKLMYWPIVMDRAAFQVVSLKILCALVIPKTQRTDASIMVYFWLSRKQLILKRISLVVLLG